MTQTKRRAAGSLGFSIHWPVEGTEITLRCWRATPFRRFSIHWPVEGTEIIVDFAPTPLVYGFSIHWPVEGTEMPNSAVASRKNE